MFEHHIMYNLYITFGAKGVLQNCTPYIAYKIPWISFLYISVWYSHCTTIINVISLEAFTATEFNEIFSVRQRYQDVKVIEIFGGTNSVPIFRA
jgi:hypothetical protein